MAYIQMNIMSQSLLRTVQVNAIVPIDKIQMPDQKEKANIKKKDFKTLYLLHGIFGSQVDWINGTKLQRWAEEKNIVVIMPAGENKFYLDIPETHDYYGKFIGVELPKLIQEMFPVSNKREDTFIGGLSMGGYGALRNGLKYYDTFGGIVSLSAADPTSGDDDSVEKIMGKNFFETIFGSNEMYRGFDNNIEYLINQNAEKKCMNQKIFLTCGTEDALITCTRKLQNIFTFCHYDLTYQEAPGGHEWDFWNAQIKQAIDWIEPAKGNMGITSGNVGL